MKKMIERSAVVVGGSVSEAGVFFPEADPAARARVTDAYYLDRDERPPEVEVHPRHPDPISAAAAAIVRGGARSVGFKVQKAGDAVDDSGVEALTQATERAVEARAAREAGVLAMKYGAARVEYSWRDGVWYCTWTQAEAP